MTYSLTLDIGSPLTFDRQNRLGVQHQDIYSHSVDCTKVPWESLTSMVISLALFNGSHHWLVIKWFLPCLTSEHCNHMDRIVLVENETNTLGTCLALIAFPRLRWSFVYQAWIQICMVVAMLKFVSVLHRSTLYIWQLLTTLMLNN